MYTEGSLRYGCTVWRLRGAAAAVVPADGCIDVTLHGDNVHLADPSIVCIPTSPDVDETIGVRFDPGLATRMLWFNPAEARDLAAPLRDVVRVIHVAKAVRILRTLRSFETAPKVDLLTSPADGRVGLVRRAAAAGVGATQVAREIGWFARHLRRRMLVVLGYGCSALVWVVRMRRALSLMRPERGSPAGPAAAHWLSRTATKGQPESEPSLAAMAHAAGYMDQVHMTRDSRLLMGRIPTQVTGSQAQRLTELPSGS